MVLRGGSGITTQGFCVRILHTNASSSSRYSCTVYPTKRNESGVTTFSIGTTADCKNGKFCVSNIRCVLFSMWHCSMCVVCVASEARAYILTEKNRDFEQISGIGKVSVSFLTPKYRRG